MDFNFYTADVFTTAKYGGNQLAVFPQASGLNDEQMQKIAREFNLSETIFIFPPDDPKNTVKVRIFTPYVEIPFAGHPTVGAAYVLATLGRIKLSGPVTEIVFEEQVGPVPIKILADSKGNVIKTELSAAQVPEVLPNPPSADVVAELLSLNPDDVVTDKVSPAIVKAGTARLFVPLKNRDALASLTVDLAKCRQHLANYLPDRQSIYAYCFDPERVGSDLRGRMFAIPAMGIYEDAATGSAVTGLASYLAQQSEQKDGTLRWVMEQGFEMGRPSILDIEADVKDGVCQAVRVGGSSVMVSKGTFFV